jgi:hypothetical protein
MRLCVAPNPFNLADKVMTADEFQAIITDILGKESAVKRASGYVIVGRSLRAAGNLKLAVNNQ